jgi:beta-barrel assembly-enhancing protease
MRTCFVPLRASLALAGALCLAPATLTQALTDTAHGARHLPALGDGGDMTLSDERRLGDQIARSIYRDPDYLDDPTLGSYLQSIWRPLLESAQQRGELPTEVLERFAWDVMLARDRTVNAFALPGGYLGVHLGLLATVASADELASVLAHELSHVSQRHIARMLSQQSKQAPWMMAGMILGALAASQAKNADIANAAIVGSQAVAMQSQLNFSRDMEREADRIGFGVMTQAGFNGAGFVTMFDKLQQASRLNDNGSFPYLRSHPLTTERIADMRSRVPDAGRGEQTTAQISQPLHALMAARARVLAETGVDRLRAQVQAMPGNSPLTDPVTLGKRYAGVLAAARLRDTDTALRGLQTLRSSLPTDPAARTAVDWLALEVLTLLQMPAAAGWSLHQLREQALASPQREAVLLGAQAALNAGSAALQSASERLQTWTTLHPRDALAWQTLASVQNALQRPVQAARSEAEARLAQLDTQGALDRLKSAQQQARQSRQVDHFELSIIDARAREVEKQVRQQFCDQQEHKDAIACQRLR